MRQRLSSRKLVGPVGLKERKRSACDFAKGHDLHIVLDVEDLCEGKPTGLIESVARIRDDCDGVFWAIACSPGRHLAASL